MPGIPSIWLAIAMTMRFRAGGASGYLNAPFIHGSIAGLKIERSYFEKQFITKP
jgi:hypothetical protein